MCFTLIIPAHNEEAVIARCLRAALADAPDPAEIEIIVAANGCNDRTVEIASAFGPHIKVLDLPEGSKTGAINAANQLASGFPRIFLDADVECNYHSLAALAHALEEPEVMIAAPKIRLSLEHTNWFVRSYYAAWMKQPYAKSGSGGSGCYALSEDALAQVGEFPPIMGDDIWIHTRFARAQKRLVSQDKDGRQVFSIVRPPSTAMQQVQVEARRMLGNAEVKRSYPSPHFDLISKSGGLLASLRSGASLRELAIFYGVKALVRLETRRRQGLSKNISWTRDLSSREI
ncbi:MAG: glycosyltransferase family 2 protein [Pseudomonadota bacterium]